MQRRWPDVHAAPPRPPTPDPTRPDPTPTPTPITMTAPTSRNASTDHTTHADTFAPIDVDWGSVFFDGLLTGALVGMAAGYALAENERPRVYVNDASLTEQVRG